MIRPAGDPPNSIVLEVPEESGRNASTIPLVRPVVQAPLPDRIKEIHCPGSSQPYHFLNRVDEASRPVGRDEGRIQIEIGGHACSNDRSRVLTIRGLENVLADGILELVAIFVLVGHHVRAGQQQASSIALASPYDTTEGTGLDPEAIRDRNAGGAYVDSAAERVIEGLVRNGDESRLDDVRAKLLMLRRDLHLGRQLRKRKLFRNVDDQ